MLERERVPATFFVVGRAVDRDPSAIARMQHDGDAIGNHSDDHAHLILLAPAAVRDELARTDAAIRRAGGVPSGLVRPPFGQRDALVLDAIRARGEHAVTWSVPLADDWDSPPAATIAARILAGVHPGTIVVLHDGDRGRACAAGERRCERTQTVAATARIIAALRAQGYRFVTVPALMRMSSPANE